VSALPPPAATHRSPVVEVTSAPVTAEPTMHDGMTRSGWAAANGIAPSVTNEAPSSQQARPFSRSASLHSFLRTAVASAMPSGGVMPAAITAAMICSPGPPVATAVLRPAFILGRPAQDRT